MNDGILPLAILITFVVLCPGIVMIVGAIKMMRLESRGWAMTASILALLPFGLVNPLGLAVGIWSLIVLNRRNVRLAFEAVGRDPAIATGVGNRATTSRGRVVFLWVLAAVVLVCACPLGIVAMIFPWYVSHSRDVIVPGPPPDWRENSPESLVTHPAGSLSAAKWRGWDWGPDGPEIDEPLARSGLGLNDSRIEEVNKVLQAAHHDYLALEKLHREHKRTDDGHQVTIVRRFKLLGVEDRLWSQLDALFAAEDQERIARLNLKFLPRYRYPEAGSIGLRSGDYANPGVLGFGGDPARVEIWRVGDWYHWRVDVYTGEGEPDFTAMQRDFAANLPAAQSGPELPHELRRFWIDPPPEKEPPSPPEAEPEKSP